MTLRVDDPDLDVNADDVLVLRNAGPKGAPGMPEAGYLPIPKKLARGGVKDMVRISDARMSGTAFGTIVLHITPESAVGGPLALVRNGDMIRLDVAKRSIDLLVDDAELEKRRAALAPARRRNGRNAATRICSTRRFCRPTKAATSISCAGRARISPAAKLNYRQFCLGPLLWPRLTDNPDALLTIPRLDGMIGKNQKGETRHGESR